VPKTGIGVICRCRDSLEESAYWKCDNWKYLEISMDEPGPEFLLCVSNIFSGWVGPNMPEMQLRKQG